MISFFSVISKTALKFVRMKKDLLLLHGALGASVQFKELAALLERDFQCHLFDFPGHGSGEDTVEMSIEVCANALRAYVNQSGLSNPLVFGYSMGGYAALYVESMYPNTFESIITLGTKFNWSEEIAEKEIGQLNPVKMVEKVPKFAQYLDRIQQPKDWRQVMLGTQQLMRRLGTNPLLNHDKMQSIRIPVLLALGEEDNMVTREETEQVQGLISNADFKVLPAVPHPIQQIDPKIIADLLLSTLLDR